MKMKLVAVAMITGLLLVGLSGVSQAATTVINFDDVSAPNNFSETTSLTNEYASQGVIFSGGGAILNQNGNFGLNAYSGQNFLAFNFFSYATDPENITFSALVSNVSIYAGTGSGFSSTFTINAYDVNHSLLDTYTLTTQAWSLLSVSAAGIKSIELSQSGNYTFVYDNLSFTSVPVPPTLLLFAPGLLGLVGLKRKYL
jgi:hypothetical protein